MDDKLIDTIKKNMEAMSTDDLINILIKEDKNEFSEERYEAISQILADRKDKPLKRSANDYRPQHEYISTYRTARVMAQIVSFLGWIMFAVGIVILIFILNEFPKKYFYIEAYSLIVLLPGLVTSLTGLIFITFGQFTRATIDTADNTGKMLLVLTTLKVQK